MGIMVNLEVQIVSSTAGHRVVVTADGREIHRTIDYPDLDFAKMHAKQIGEQASELVALHFGPR